MTEIFNNKVVEVASGIKADMNTVIDAVTNIRRNRKSDGTSRIKDADLAADLASVRTIAAKYGFGSLAAWKGNDEPVPPEVVLE